MKRFIFILALILSNQAFSNDNILRTQNAYSICTKPDMDWINFCNGLIQGYSEYIILSNQACIPVGVTRTQLVTVFTGKLMKMTKAFQSDLPAIEGAKQVFKLAYPCNSA